MDAFDDIRPYRDEEVSAAVARLARNPNLVDLAAHWVAPSLSRWCGPLVRARVRRKLGRALAGVETVASFQRQLARLFEQMVASTTDSFGVTGAEHLDRRQRYLFVSNHRDIGLDSGFANFALHRAGHPTTRNAIGDNLLATDFAAEVFRLNKAFVVRRSAKGAKAVYAAMLETSQYIRHSLESGESVWIAQREGRAKDGWDRTDPAIIKMFALAFRDETDDLGEIARRLRIVPMSISYELDPCDLMKARELAVMASDGSYQKRPGEDLASVVAGITGRKGRVHLQFGTPLDGPFADAASVADAIDRQVIRGYRLFPTHLWAAEVTGMQGLQTIDSSPALDELKARVESAPEELRGPLLLQYANPVRRAREMGLLPRT